MTRRVRAHDWSATPLGPIEGWPAGPRAVMELVLASPLASSLVIGPERVLLYNDAAARLLGERHPGALGRPLREIWPEAHAVAAPLCDRAFAGEAVAAPARPLDLAPGGGEVFEFYATPVRGEDGAVAAVHVTGFEVGARRRAEAALRASEERQAFLLDLVDALRPFADPVAIQEAAGRLLAGHLGVARAFYVEFAREDGRADAAIEGGRPAERLGPCVEALRGGRAVAVRDTEAERASVAERAAWRALGVRAHLSVPLVKDGRVAAGIGAHHEAPRAWSEAEIRLVEEVVERVWAAVERARVEAALRESEARLRALAEASSEALYRMGPDWGEMRELTGGGFLADTRGPSRAWLLDYIPPEEQARGLAAIDEAIRAKAVFALEHRVRRADGSLGWTRSRAVPILGPQGEVVEWFGAASDITARKEAERRQAVLLRLADALRPLTDAAAIQGEACRLLAEALEVERACYVEIDEARAVVAVTREHAREGAPSLAGRHPASAFAWSLGLLRRDALLVGDTRSSPLVPEAARAGAAALGIVACLGAPLVEEGRLAGALCVAEARPRDWSGAEAALLRDAAERVWAAMGRARAEALLRESEERLRAILETARDYAILTTDARGRVETWSRGAQEVLGWSADEIVGQTIDVTFTPQDRAEGAPERERRTARERGQAPDVRWHLRQDGRLVFIEGSSRPLTGPDGALRGFVKVGRDVTERRATEDRLRASEALFRQFTEASSDVLWIRDAVTLRFEHVSPAFEAIYGANLADLLARNDLRAWAELIHPDDREAVIAHLRRVRAGERVTHEFRIRRASDGEERWIRDTDFPLVDERGRVERVAGIGQDVTELKRAAAALAESERRLRTLAEGIPQLVWRASDHGAWSWASPQWTAFTGQPEAASRGWGWLEALHPDDREGAREAWARSRATGVFEAEYRLREAATGEHRWFQSRAAPVLDDAGRLVEWLGTSTDVQDLREMQGRLRVLVAELQHRTRNLMAVVLGLMRRTAKDSADVEGFASDFRSRLEALARVQGLLSRLEEGDRVAFDELIRAELGAVGALDPEGRGARVALAGPKDVRLRSSTVQTFALALHELATNALKYGALSQADGRLVVRWRRLRGPDGPRLRVEWTESGVAMPEPGAAAPGGGYGRELIERALPYQLGAETRYEMGADGVRCAITLPLSSSAERADA